MGEDAARQGAQGLWEEVKGRLKGAAGALTGRRDLEREGVLSRTRPRRSEARPLAGRGGRARAEADVHEARQRHPARRVGRPGAGT